MKLDKIVRKIAGNAVSGCLLALSASVAYCGAMGPASTNSPGRIYVGVFGGGGAVSGVNLTQSGTAFFIEALGGPLAIDGYGTSRSSSTGVVGGHIGFAWSDNLGVHYPLMPAVELEGYYMGGVNIEGHDIGSNTTRLEEHDFLVKYPLSTGVFLVNAVLNADNSLFGRFKPYVGVGIGSALVSVSNASAIQVSPAEPGVNHYNGRVTDREVGFAAQPKVGVHFDLSIHTSVFAEYRFLYVSQTNYSFGSTVVAGHAATAPWLVSIKPQYYNMGTVGIEFDV